ncbi:hypothetical protein SODALDRAFT_32427 [Sodiomyces alkalinus F11]|uniref:Uncharacterized protein n=1 Tax=Sodiomyces alkalinus (strain CBS 110278 / VKM F-3762 / F11) TaxID=1314773 RepID=A0A3N2Q8Z8_SODAK|nr:hypothetical protein SODALDRAFT_32427 [Sodiomyces alkalinus F11]ROT43167.1 hypothetical protein SODALDRAFT_32427 [Sodiomyces alkalinus F11]
MLLQIARACRLCYLQRASVDTEARLKTAAFVVSLRRAVRELFRLFHPIFDYRWSGGGACRDMILTSPFCVLLFRCVSGVWSRDFFLVSVLFTCILMPKCWYLFNVAHS